jgi:hypothetical protein
MVSDDDNLILDCYRLARWYHCSPDTFLNMPISDVHLHLRRTTQLARLMRQEADDDG